MGVLAEVELSHGAFKEVLVPEYKDLRAADRGGCRYGAACHSFSCNYSHPCDRVAKCRYGKECYNRGCAYLHPRGWKAKQESAEVAKPQTNDKVVGGKPARPSEDFSLVTGAKAPATNDVETKGVCSKCTIC